ncbi:unnamed protein product [Dovyalis caffra]|uniref:Uncharacterized protein n=1 Tax=Dovyalis caffra TaxID=77055 RepID=A0AAV1SJK8_9ROSI|nr:unnamed protein product [Dovyalis caffra]
MQGAFASHGFRFTRALFLLIHSNNPPLPLGRPPLVREETTVIAARSKSFSKRDAGEIKSSIRAIVHEPSVVSLKDIVKRLRVVANLANLQICRRLLNIPMSDKLDKLDKPNLKELFSVAEGKQDLSSQVGQGGDDNNLKDIDPLDEEFKTWQQTLADNEKGWMRYPTRDAGCLHPLHVSLPLAI